jgi:chorismate synthase
MAFEIREFNSIEDHDQCTTVQRQVWAGDDPVITNMTVTVGRHGGMLLGAFETDGPTPGRMIGFVMGMLSPAHVPGANLHLSQHSHIAAVLPEFQGQRVGEQLKRRQAEWCRTHGFNLVTWTFDPMRAVNAHLNIHKLGAVCRTYIPNCYGYMRDVLNEGLPSDRFEVEWWLDRETLPDGTLRMASGHLRIDPGREDLRIYIPRDFQAEKRDNLDRAHDILLQVRAQFTEAYAAGYVVVDFSLQPDTAYFVLTKPL